MESCRRTPEAVLRAVSRAIAGTAGALWAALSGTGRSLAGVAPAGLQLRVLLDVSLILRLHAFWACDSSQVYIAVYSSTHVPPRPLTVHHWIAGDEHYLVQESKGRNIEGIATGSTITNTACYRFLPSFRSVQAEVAKNLTN